MITFENVSYTYPQATTPALRDVTLHIAEGEFVVVIGASGSGKSTLLRAINGLVPHFYGGSFTGRVLVDGRDTRTHEPRDLAGTVGFVFQDPEAQMVVERVEDEIVFGMENLGVPTAVMRRRVEEVLDQLEIAHLRYRPISTLSGGERQRVAIAAVLALHPRVLVLDEPTSQLDPHTAEEVLTALHKLNADLGLTIVLSEHRLERVVQYADRLILCRRDAAGQPRVQSDTPRAILAMSQLAPPLTQLGRALGWQPLPLTVKEARRFVVQYDLDRPNGQPTHPPASPAPATDTATRRAPPLLEVRDLSVYLGEQEILYHVSLALHPGTITAIMGRNGSGKTTLLRAIMGLTPPSTGTVLLHGQPIDDQAPEQRAVHIGYVPQDPRALLFHETVADEARWTLRQLWRGASPTALEARLRSTLEQLELQALAARHPRELSGGEQQRAALAAILVADPQVLLLDEPTRGLDYDSKQRLVALLATLKQRGRAIALVTHDVELVATCADRILLLGNGEVVVEGTPRELLNTSIIFSSQIGKLFRHRSWLTVQEALAGLRAAAD
ncbi:ABC transporter ATP-binding protein [Kallotenue papyrolyticum]|uniref:ABC transporter ATP-binding protein n=1 Tax=Kallotenue papyrolyticum TaxID=1325125 RepID=UPI0004785D02|nr:energy-coupling factor ABC transporter ATP-binding protein [Kallotenue papyrolyticum]